MRFYCNCFSHPSDSRTLLCTGPAHKHPRAFHSECVDADDWPDDKDWFCAQCRESYGGDLGALVGDQDSQESQGSQQSQVALDVTAIEDCYLKDGVLHFKVQLAETESQQSESSDQPFYHLGQSSLMSGFFKKWTNFPQAGYRPGDDASGNPYVGSLRVGYWAVVEQLLPDLLAHTAIKRDHNEASAREDTTLVLASVPLTVLFGISGATGLRARKTTDIDLFAWL